MAKVTIAVFRDYMRSENQKVDNVARLQAALDAADLAINLYTQRGLNTVDTSATARSFRPGSGGQCFLTIQDCTEITSVVENGTTLTFNTGYQTYPYATAATAGGINGAGETVAFSGLERLDTYWYANPPRPTVIVTAKWGWPAIPAPVVEACKMLAKDIATSRERVGDAAGFGDFGMVRLRQSPYITTLLAPYRTVRAMGLA